MIAALSRWQWQSSPRCFLAMAFLPSAASADALDRIRQDKVIRIAYRGRAAVFLQEPDATDPGRAELADGGIGPTPPGRA